MNPQQNKLWGQINTTNINSSIRWAHSLNHIKKENFIVETWTQVFRVRAEYPNQLDYNGWMILMYNLSHYISFFFFPIKAFFLFQSLLHEGKVIGHGITSTFSCMSYKSWRKIKGNCSPYKCTLNDIIKTKNKCNYFSKLLKILAKKNYLNFKDIR